MLKVVLLMAAGGLLTSLAEYRFQYNLFDYAKDGVLKIVGFFKGK